ncbi:hypothetical protein OROGR_013263 [Orobanche gracilis]
MEKAATGADILEVWNEETVPKVMRIVSTRLSQRDLISLLLVSPWIHRNLISHPLPWLVLDFHEMNTAGDRLVAALSVSKYQNVKHINLEFARDVEDKHLEIVKSKCGHSIKNLEVLNLNGCQKISDMGIEFITCNCPKLKVFSIYWNVRVSDLGISNLVKNCKLVVDLNLSGCKNVTDESLKLIADNYQELQLLNLTRCVKLTDKDLAFCNSLTDVAYEKISVLSDLEFLDLCGAQNLSDDGVSCIAKCKKLISLNLTWCVRVTDQGVVAIAQGCRFLEFLSLFGIGRRRDQLLELFPKLKCFKVHS